MIAKTLTKLVHSAFFKSILLLTSGSVVSQFIVLLGLPIIARIYSPDDFGLFAIFSATSGVLLTVSSLRFEISIPLARTWRNAKQIFSISVGINVMLALASLGFVGFFSSQLASWFGEKELAQVLWLLPIVLISGGIFKALNYLALWESAFRHISISKVLQGIALVLSQIVLGFLGAGALGLAIGLILGQVVGTFWLIRNKEFVKGFCDASKSYARTLSLVKKNKSYAQFDTPASLIGSLSHHFPNIIFAALFSPASAGVYYIVERMYAVPSGVLGRSIGQVIHANIRIDLESGQLQHRLLLVLGGLMSVTVIPVWLLYFYAEPIFKLLLGESWHDAGEVATWLVFSVAVQFVYSALSMVLVATGGHLKNILIHTFLFLFKLAGILVGYTAGSFILAVQCLVFAQVAGYGIALIVLTLHTKRVTENASFKLNY